MNRCSPIPARSNDHVIDVDPVGVIHVEIPHVDVGESPLAAARSGAEPRPDRVWG